MNRLDQRSYFFDEGLSFECRRCGSCCTGDPGIVEVNQGEMADIGVFLRLPVSQVVEVFLYRWKNGHAIGEDSDGRCLFFEDGCRIYPVRPKQCKTFPFWLANLRSESRWNQIRSQCPGIGSGRLYTKAEILDTISRSFDTPL
jgi:hypothetical protein